VHAFEHLQNVSHQEHHMKVSEPIFWM